MNKKKKNVSKDGINMVEHQDSKLTTPMDKFKTQLHIEKKISEKDPTISKTELLQLKI